MIKVSEVVAFDCTRSFVTVEHENETTQQIFPPEGVEIEVRAIPQLIKDLTKVYENWKRGNHAEEEVRDSEVRWR